VTGDRRVGARPRILTIAGSDSGGGAGIQADLKTFSALGAFGMTAITAVTVQNSEGVQRFEALSASLVRDQIHAAVTDIGVDAAKTGMLANADIVGATAGSIADTGVPNLVIDPVFVSKHGHPLLAADAVDALRGELLPLATIVTPNLPEAAGLADLAVVTRDDMRRAAGVILELGPAAVLVKGGHLDGASDAADLFVTAEAEEWLVAERIDSPHTHGTGCTLSAAIAVHLGAGMPLLEAARGAKAFVTEAIRAAVPMGRGIGPVDHLWSVGRS